MQWLTRELKQPCDETVIVDFTISRTGFTIVLAHMGNLQLIREMCLEGDVVAEFDTQFNLAPCYRSALKIPVPLLDQEPFLEAVVLLHSHKNSETYALTGKVLQWLPVLDRLSACVVDFCQAEFNGLSQAFPQLTLIGCTEHLRTDLSFGAARWGVPASQMKVFANKIIGDSLGRDGLLNAATHEEYCEQCNKFEEEIAEYDAFLTYFVEQKYRFYGTFFFLTSMTVTSCSNVWVGSAQKSRNPKLST